MEFPQIQNCNCNCSYFKINSSNFCPAKQSQGKLKYLAALPRGNCCRPGVARKSAFFDALRGGVLGAIEKGDLVPRDLCPPQQGKKASKTFWPSAM
eukprot:6490000-Amphidinium_carterae.1